MSSKSKKKSIVVRSALFSSLVTGILCAFVFFLLYTNQKNSLESGFHHNNVENIRKVTAFIIGFFYSQGNWIHLHNHQKLLNDGPNVLYSYIVSENGKIDFGINGLESQDVGLTKQDWEPPINVDLSQTRRIKFVADEELAKSTIDSIEPGQEITLIATPIHCPNVGHPCAELRVGTSSSNLMATLNELAYSLTFIAILFSIATGLCVFFIVNYSLIPIRRVSKAMQRLAGEHQIDKIQKLDDIPTDSVELENFQKSLAAFHRALIKAARLENDLNVATNLSDLAAQVAHDIRSPLAALQVVADGLPASQNEEERVAFRRSLNRIRDIANNLVRRYQSRAIDNEHGVHHISSLLDAIISEKRIQYASLKDIVIDRSRRKDSYDVFADVEPEAFRRVISNIIDNSVEAIEEKGNITASVYRDLGNIFICICDDGKGIESLYQAKIFDQGVTIGKKHGTGLGLHYVKTKVNEWGGSVQASSEPGAGTRLCLVLPSAPPPRWFIPALEINKGHHICVLDDDQGIHDVWTSRLTAAGIDPSQVIHYYSADAIVLDHKDTQNQHSVYLIDYELLGSDRTGLDIIEQLNLRENTILVTNRYEEHEVIDRVIKLGITLLPKDQAQDIPISVRDLDIKSLAQAGNKKSLVLIDDDVWVRKAWEVAAKKQGYEVQSFATREEFIRHKTIACLEQPIFVDVYLGDDTGGIDLAKELIAQGYRRVYLATGLEIEHLDEASGLAGVVGKDFPSHLL